MLKILPMKGPLFKNWKGPVGDRQSAPGLMYISTSSLGVVKSSEETFIELKKIRIICVKNGKQMESN